MSTGTSVVGDKSREALDALQGYVYQLFQSAAAWVELNDDGVLLLEVAEDFAVVAKNAINAVQVKSTAANITLNSPGVIAAINSQIQLAQNNPGQTVSLRYLTTSLIGRERAHADKVEGEPVLLAWRKIAKAGDTNPLRLILNKSAISDASKEYISTLDDDQFRSKLLKQIHFDCGAPSVEIVRKWFRSRLHKLIQREGGTIDQLNNCESAILHRLLLSCAGKEERAVTRVDLLEIVQRSTRVQISQAHLDARLLHSLTTATVPSGLTVQPERSSAILPLPELPQTRLARDALRNEGFASVARSGLLWLNGGTGQGKTMLARLVANHCGGRWGSVNLRGASATHVSLMLLNVSDALPLSGFNGLIIDDLEYAADATVADAFQNLMESANQSDVPVVITSSSGIPSKLMFAIGVDDQICLKANDFSEDEIGALIELLGGNPAHWRRYVYLSSGGGHPQLAQALVQNLRQRNWPLTEMDALPAIFGDNPAIADVRRETRIRLLRELPEGALILLQRLSLHTGRFKRKMALELGRHGPAIANAGFLLDELVGPWIDQPDAEHYQTSPLLSGLAIQTLSKTEQKSIHKTIADLLTSGPSLDAAEMNSALLSAMASQNESALLRICTAIITTPTDGLRIISEYMHILGYMSASELEWPVDPHQKAMLRAAQLITTVQTKTGQKRIPDLLTAFQSAIAEATDIRFSYNLETLIYVKLLVSGRLVPDFPRLVARLSDIASAARTAAPPMDQASQLFSVGGVDVSGFTFLVQLGHVEKIDELLPIFKFVEQSSSVLRAELLSPLKRSEFEADMYVRSAWLSEDRLPTTDWNRHASTFAELEEISAKWETMDIAVSCCKLRAIILDEHAKKPDEALAVLESGFQRYGLTNSEIVRAKAKILHRAGDHSGSLDLSGKLIDQNLISNPVERAFLGRDAAISAERNKDYAAARRYYLYARDASREAAIESMRPMEVGLLADAALASWHLEDRKGCLQDYAKLLDELAGLDPSSSLRAAHVRAVSQHVLLWMDQHASGEVRSLPNGEPPQIYPGCISNPEPHPDIKSWPVVPLELAWHMLAGVECMAGVDAGITTDLDKHLPKGPILEGQMILSRGRTARALFNLDWPELVKVVRSAVDQLAYINAKGGPEKVFKLPNVTYGRFPRALAKEVETYGSLAKNHALLFAILSVARDDITSLCKVIESKNDNNVVLTIDPEIERLMTNSESAGYRSNLLGMLKQQRHRIVDDDPLDPHAIVYLMYTAIELATTLDQMKTVSEVLEPWYREKCFDFISSQRFRLVAPNLHVPVIEETLARSSSYQPAGFIELVLATLPATNIRGQTTAVSFLQETRSALLKRSLSAIVDPQVPPN